MLKGRQIAGIYGRPARYISEKEVTMKSSHPIKRTNQPTKSTNYLFPSTMVSSFLALMACTTLTPKTQNHSANYIDPKATAANQSAQVSDPGYNWFY